MDDITRRNFFAGACATAATTALAAGALSGCASKNSVTKSSGKGDYKILSASDFEGSTKKSVEVEGKTLPVFEAYMPF